MPFDSEHDLVSRPLACKEAGVLAGVGLAVAMDGEQERGFRLLHLDDSSIPASGQTRAPEDRSGARLLGRDLGAMRTPAYTLPTVASIALSEMA